MSKGKAKSFPAPVSHVAKEVKAGGHVLLWIVAGIAAVALIGPSLGSRATNAALKGVVDTAKNTATGVCTEDGLNHLCALPANGSRVVTAPTSVPASPPPKAQPYGEPNGTVRPLPSQAPAAPQIGPAPPPPVLSGPSGGLGPLGELLAKIPEVGPAVEGGLKAIGPAASTAAKP